MAKECPDCRSMMTDEAPECGACGRRFPFRQPARRGLKIEYMLIAVLVALAALILFFAEYPAALPSWL
jgi:hypothetical protein